MKWYYKDPDPKSYRTITTLAQLEELTSQILQSEGIAIDTETTGVHTQASIVGLSVAGRDFSPAYIPVAHTEGTQLPVNRVKMAVHSWLSVPWYGQNFKFDYVMMKRNGWPSKPPDEDSIFLSHLLDPDRESHGMDYLALTLLGYETVKFSAVVNKRLKRDTFADVPIAEATRYAAEDADITLRLVHILKDQLPPDLVELYETVYKPLGAVLASLELQGMCVCLETLKSLENEFSQASEALLKEVTKTTGDTNLNSPKQLRELLFTKLGLKPLKKSPKGEPSTDRESLEALVYEAPFIQHLLDYRKLAKLTNTYTSTLQEQAIKDANGDWRIHGSFNPTGTATGRLSSSRPNMQNLPSHGDLGTKVRQAFIAPPGYMMVAADYSQAELRVLGHFSGDPTFLHAFETGIDLHTETAKQVFTDGREPTKEERFKAKAISFGLVYGLTAKGLSKRINVSLPEAEEYIEKYFKRFPKIHDYLETAKANARRDKFITTLAGRRRLLPDIDSNNIWDVYRAERLAQNAPIQGSVADIVNAAMIKVHSLIQEGTLNARFVNTVHDELLFEIKDEDLSQTEIIRDVMENVYKLNVKMLVDIGVGINWADAH